MAWLQLIQLRLLGVRISILGMRFVHMAWLQLIQVRLLGLIISFLGMCFFHMAWLQLILVRLLGVSVQVCRSILSLTCLGCVI